ncbi:DUF6300 family protein [Streptomyces sp. NPDC002952]|uniref:DUF6300 family protein n=1 Tax=Streptomyces sp. NPDC002952 TaxID=3364673 RepID=UPI0036B15740
MRSRELPGCSRCGQQQLLTTAAMPKKDALGKPIVLELCKVCDAKRLAAAAVIDFFATGGGHDLARAREGARLLTEWTTEGMAAYGWYPAEPGPGHR